MTEGRQCMIRINNTQQSVISVFHTQDHKNTMKFNAYITTINALKMKRISYEAYSDLCADY